MVRILGQHSFIYLLEVLSSGQRGRGSRAYPRKSECKAGIHSDWAPCRNERTWKKPTGTCREHVKRRIDSNPSPGSNQGPWSCKGSMLPCNYVLMTLRQHDRNATHKDDASFKYHYCESHQLFGISKNVTNIILLTIISIARHKTIFGTLLSFLQPGRFFQHLVPVLRVRKCFTLLLRLLTQKGTCMRKCKCVALSKTKSQSSFRYATHVQEFTLKQQACSLQLLDVPSVWWCFT